MFLLYINNVFRYPQKLTRALLQKTLYDMTSAVVWLQQLVAIDKFIESTPHTEKHLLFLKIQNQVKYVIINKKIIEFLNKVADLPPQEILKIFNKQLDVFANEVVKEWAEEVPKKLELGNSAENVLRSNINFIFNTINSNVKPVLEYPVEDVANQNFGTLSSWVKHRVINDKIDEVVAPKLKKDETTKEVSELLVDLIDNTSLVNDIVVEIKKQFKRLIEENNKENKK